jgi:hypothetical protein
MVQYLFHPKGICALYSRHVACTVTAAAIKKKKDGKVKAFPVHTIQDEWRYSSIHN